MIWYDYLPQIVVGILTLWVLIISYFFIKRRYTQSSVTYQNSTGESEVYASNEHLFNESLSESLNLDQEKKTMDINYVMRCSSDGSTEGEMPESKNYTTTQDVSDTCKFNSDSHSSIMSWESCHEEIIRPELDFVNCLSSESYPEICQPLNLCMRDRKNETGTNKVTRTFFTDRRHKIIKGIQKTNSEKYLVTKMIEDYDQGSSLDYEKIKNPDCFEDKEYTLNNYKLEYNLDNIEHENNLEITKPSSTYQGELEDEYNLLNTKHELRDEHNLEITEISSIHHDELMDENSLDDTEHELRDEQKLELTEISSINHDELKDEYSSDMTEHELRAEHNLEITEISSIHHDELMNENKLDKTELHLKNKNHLEISSIHHDEYSLDNTEHELKHENNLEITKISSINHDELKDEYSSDMTEHELRAEHNLEITEISSIHHDELMDENSLDDTEQELKDDYNLDISELSSIHHEELEDEYSLNYREHSFNDDHVMLEKDLETTRLSPIYQNEKNDEYNFLTSPELSSLNNDKSISGIDSPNIICHHDFEVQDINGFNNTSSSECTESFPSPIFNNDSLIDDIRYVEDYNDISFFDPTLSEDAMNEAFVEDIIVEEI